MITCVYTFVNICAGMLLANSYVENGNLGVRTELVTPIITGIRVTSTNKLLMVEN